MNEKNKKLIVKIVVPIFIVSVLAVIWVGKKIRFNAKTQTTAVSTEFALHTDSIDLEKLKQYKLPIILDFGADWCIPCQEMESTLIAINKEMQGKAIVKFIDINKNGEFSKNYPIRVIPSQVFIDFNGNPYVPSEGMKIQFDIYRRKDNNEHAITVHEGPLTEHQLRDILKDMGVKS